MQNYKLHDVYIALGTNLGNKKQNIVQAIRNIEERVGMVISHSAFYITKPVGFESENNFVNAACVASTSLQPLEILAITKEIEIEMGRQSKSANGVYSDRIIDIDLLMYDDIIINHPKLTLPHPHLHKREFVLFPLMDIAQDVIHPILNRTIAELFAELKAQTTL